MDAIILAGGALPDDLAAALSAQEKQQAHHERALLPLNNKPLIAWMLQSLHDCDQIERIIIVGSEATLQHAKEWDGDIIEVLAQQTLSANVLAGLEAARGQQVLMTTCDIPMVTARTWEHFLHLVKTRELQAGYPIVRDSVMESTFPGGKRTYVKLREGRFTGGNAFVLPLSCKDELEKVLETVYTARKKPYKLAALLGFSFIIKGMLQRLTIGDAEQKVSQILQCPSGAVEMDDAGIAYDVDKAHDYEYLKTIL